jgi:hypothetical protein
MLGPGTSAFDRQVGSRFDHPNLAYGSLLGSRLGKFPRG